MRILSILLLCFLIKISYAQNGVGTMFPELSGETFSGKNISIPKDTKGKKTVVGICFSKDAEEELKTWLNPVYNLFVVKKDTNDFFSAAVNYDVNFYFVPMLNKVNQVLENGSKKKIKEGTDKEFWPYLVFYTGETKTHIEALKVADKKIPYFLVLDATGKIVHVVSGKFTQAKMDSIEDKLD